MFGTVSLPTKCGEPNKDQNNLLYPIWSRLSICLSLQKNISETISYFLEDTGYES